MARKRRVRKTEKRIKQRAQGKQEEKAEDEENQTPNKKYGTLGTIGGTLTLKRKHKTPDSDEPQVDPKMATLRKNLHTEDGGEKKLF